MTAIPVSRTTEQLQELLRFPQRIVLKRYPANAHVIVGAVRIAQSWHKVCRLTPSQLQNYPCL